MAEANNTSAHPSPLSKRNVSFGLGFVLPILERREGESLVFLKASESKHHLTVIFSLWSYEVTCFSGVHITPVPVSLNPARAGVPAPPHSAPPPPAEHIKPS